jgi:hypothetical protein
MSKGSRHPHEAYSNFWQQWFDAALIEYELVNRMMIRQDIELKQFKMLQHDWLCLKFSKCRSPHHSLL